MSEEMMGLRSYIREMPGKGRCDFSKLFRDARAFAELVERLGKPFEGDGVTHVAGIDALGFALAGAVAVKLGAGFAAIRKGGKSAWTARAQSFVDYSRGEKTLELVEDALDSSCRVLIVDEWSETGAQLEAAIELCRATGTTIVGATVLNADEGARKRLAGRISRLHGVIQY
jgi:adenine phosphoribosyltransferase